MFTLATILDNPGEPPADTRYRDVNLLRQMGYDGVAIYGSTGLPLRIGGTTATLQPRECQFGLEWAAKLTDEHVGQTFWVSGIEIGDDVFTDLVTTVELKG